jgi:WD40 repeat protein
VTSPSGELLASGSDDCVCVWSIESGNVLRRFIGEGFMYSTLICALGFSDRLTALANNGCITQWDVESLGSSLNHSDDYVVSPAVRKVSKVTCSIQYPVNLRALFNVANGY